MQRNSNFHKCELIYAPQMQLKSLLALSFWNMSQNGTFSRMLEHDSHNMLGKIVTELTLGFHRIRSKILQNDSHHQIWDFILDYIWRNLSRISFSHSRIWSCLDSKGILKIFFAEPCVGFSQNPGLISKKTIGRIFKQ